LAQAAREAPLFEGFGFDDLPADGKVLG
jgi:hypothetical protein